MRNSVVLILISFLFLSCSFFEDSSREFNKDSWENNPDSRYEMIDDLQENYLKIGMERVEVIALLGEPDSSSINYYLGFPSYNIDPEVLCIKYTDDKVSSIWVGEG